VVDVIIIDRSVHTLLAHCHALTRITAVNYYDVAQRILHGSSVPLWPDVILYLDVSEVVVNERNRGKFERNSIFIDAATNRGVRSYFEQLAGSRQPQVIWLDGAMSAAGLRDLAIGEVIDAVGRERARWEQL
jgi:thymidylate kinase